MLKHNRKKAGLACAILLFALALPAALQALPVAVEQVDGARSLRPAAFYLVDERGDMGILEASSPLRQNQYMRLEDGVPVTSTGSLWLRFSLIKNNQALMRPLPEGAQQPLHLDLGDGLRGARLYVAESVSTDGQIKTWRESMPLSNGCFALPDPDLLPLTVYVRLPGIPSLWFDPMLIRGGVDGGPFTWTLILQIAMGLTLAVMLVRGITENEEWRFWAGAILACAMIPAIFGQHGSEPRIIYLTAMPRLLAPGLAVMLMPHLGRYLLNSRGSKALDYTLIIFSAPGVLAALAPLVPGLGWTARLLPLAPLLLLPLALIALARAKGGQSGALLYFFFCFFPFMGALLALLPLLGQSFPALALLGPNLTTLGYLSGGLLLAVGRPTAPKEKGDFFPLNDLFEDSVLPGGGPRHKGEVLSLAPAAKKEEPQTDENCYPDELLDGPPLGLAHLPVPGLDCDPPAQADKTDESTAEEVAETLTEEIAEAPAEAAEQAAEQLAEQAAEPELAASAAGPDEALGPYELPQVDESAEPDEADEPGEALEADEVIELYEAAPADNLPAAAEAPEPVQEYNAEAAAQMQQDKNIIYIKDEEEPGLVILKPAGKAPIKGLAPVHPGPPAHNWEYTAISRLESALRAPYEQMVSQLEALQARQDLAADEAEGLGKSLSGLGLLLDNLERLARGEPLAPGAGQSIFNLAQLVRRIHEELLPLAEERGITLSWFVSPGLPAYFKGQEQDIAQAVKFLLQGTLEGGTGNGGGAVQLSVRQGAGPSAGQIQFSLQESGLGRHMQRPSGWLNKAWELAAASGGSFNIDSIPGRGMAISLALPLVPVHEPAPAEAPPASAPQGEEAARSGFDDDDDVILLTDAISPGKIERPEAAEQAAPAEAAPAEAESVPEQAAPAEAAQMEQTAPTQASPEQTAPEQAPPAPAPQDDLPQADAAAEKLIILSADEIMDVPIPQSANVSAPRPVAASKKPAPPAEPAGTGPREYIVIADMAASGRRLIARRLEGLPHKLAEARSADEIIRAAQRHPLGLIIIDADMPEPDVKNALDKIAEAAERNGLPPTPSLCLLAHESQAERLLRLGCSETQIKTASRVQFRQAVLRLAPHPQADPAELLPESPLLRAALQSQPAQEEQPQADKLPEQQPEPKTATPPPAAAEKTAAKPAPAEKTAKKSPPKKGPRVPMLDLIVASLDKENEDGQENAEDEEHGSSRAVGGESESPRGEADPAKGGVNGKTLQTPYPLSGSSGEYMEADMVPLIPGLLIVLEESLADLAALKAGGNAEHTQEVAARMAGQGSTFGLLTLERMARFVERAAAAKDEEAIRDFTGELLSIGRRHLAALKETHEDYLKKQ